MDDGGGGPAGVVEIRLWSAGGGPAGVVLGLEPPNSEDPNCCALGGVEGKGLDDAPGARNMAGARRSSLCDQLMTLELLVVLECLVRASNALSGDP